MAVQENNLDEILERLERMKKKQPVSQDDVCPGCGRCPTCGRRGWPVTPYPYPQPSHPWRHERPYWEPDGPQV